MDNTEPQAVNEGGAVTTPTTSPVVENQTVQTPESQEAAQAVVESERRVPRSERRIRELAAQNRELLNKQSQPEQPQMPQSPFMPNMFEEGREYTPDELQQRVVQAASSIAELQVKSALTQLERKQSGQKYVDQFDNDLKHVETAYDVLNPDSDKHDPVLTKKISTLFEKASANNPGLRLSEFVDGVMELATSAAETGKSQVGNIIAQQSSESAISPSPQSKPGPKPLSADVIAKMPRDEYRKRKDEINAWIVQETVRQD